MLKKNIEKEKRKQQRRPIGRPVRFKKKTVYDRNRTKRERERD